MYAFSSFVFPIHSKHKALKISGQSNSSNTQFLLLVLLLFSRRERLKLETPVVLDDGLMVILDAVRMSLKTY